MKTIQRQLHNGRAMTLHEVSQELGITPERARQIDRDALKKLHARLLARGIDASAILPPNYDEAKA